MCSPKLHLLGQKHNINSNIGKYCYNLKEWFSILIYILNVIYFWDAKLWCMELDDMT